ncbi:MAG: hypothetical protein HOP10_16970 [Chitinophagaceae bacterium]|nr:hypothetical protein [Chitinophagaceae bacterium]
MRLVLLFIFFIFSSVISGNAQINGNSATAAGGNFEDDRGRHFWMGANYRKEWNTPITVPLLNLATEKGGLTPVKRGGGKQTKSLRVEDKNGREYVIRSITKYITSKTLPGDLQSEAAADLVADGISASYPYAPLSVAVLAEAAGIPHGNPKLMYIGDDPKLGEFREDFKNMLVMIEERVPDGVNKAHDSEEIVEKMQKDNDNDVDQKALLTIRILDMFVMDLDRHEGQWTWGSRDHGKGKMYYPIAKDRDQAFYINQGLLPGFVKGRALVPQLEGFKPKANSIARFNFAARNFDRYFLTELSESDWKAAVDKFILQMTDEVIDKAMAAQPAEIRDISGGKIAQTLKDRRNYLAAEVMEYYYFLAHIVSVTGSDKKELFDVTRNDDGSVLVQVFKIDKDGGQSVKRYERKFDPLYTEEIRLYGFDGDDQFTLNGINDKIKIRIIGGDGQDAFKNTDSRQPGTIIYDRRDGSNTVEGGFKNRMKNDTIVNSYNWVYYKYPYQSIFVNLGFNPDDGIFFGPTFKYTRHGFRKEPYKSSHQFRGLYAFSTQAVNLQYNNEFMSVFGRKTDIISDINYKGPNNTTNFFGYGMADVDYDSKPDGFRFYRIRYDLGDVSLQVRHRFSEKVSLAIGPNFQFYHYDSTDKFNKIRNVELTAPNGLMPLFDKRQSYFGVKTDLLVDTRDNHAVPSRGITWNTTFRWHSGLNDNSYNSVTQLNSDFAFYLSLIKDWLVWANRIGVGVTSGTGTTGFEFFHAQYLGSDENLRGYRKQRFAGSSKFYNQTELRLKLANLKTYLFPASFGIFAFVDAGKVSYKGVPDGDMAVGYGGGFWFAPLRRIAITASYAVSSEDALPLIGLSFKF